MIDYKDIVEQISQAIYEVMGIKLEEYAVKSRLRKLYFARMIFAKFCMDRGVERDYICSLLNRHRTTILYLENMYQVEIAHNKDFRSDVEKVSNKLNKTINAPI